jgi:hypothetical protein
VAIKFSTKDPSRTPPAKADKPAPVADARKPDDAAQDSAIDLFEPGAKKAPAKGRKKK